MVVNIIANVLSNTFFLVNKPFKKGESKKGNVWENLYSQVNLL